MTIKKYQGKTKEEAIALAKEELGESVVIMNTKEKKPEGVFGIFKKSIYEVTAALEDEPEPVSFSPSISPTHIQPEKARFSVVADENIDIDYSKKAVNTSVNTGVTANNKNNVVIRSEDVDPTTLQQAFEEISKVIENNKDATLETVVSTDNAIIKKSDVKVKERKKKEEPKENIEKPKDEAPESTKYRGENLGFIKMVYKNLIENEIDEKYINQILDDMGNIISSTNSIDYMISNIYQKMVLKLGTPRTIKTEEKGPKVVFFVGPTGVGKTTTIAKIASYYKLEKKKTVAFITADTYRIAATEQLNVYANILDVPFSVIYEPQEINSAVDNLSYCDLILVDTVGFSHKNLEQKETTKELIATLDNKYKKEVYLVLSVTTKYSDLKEIADIYKTICNYSLIFTKLDETGACGNILNLRMYTGADVSYVTNGQNVPDDIEIIDSQKIVKQFLGGK